MTHYYVYGLGIWYNQKLYDNLEHNKSGEKNNKGDNLKLFSPHELLY